MTKKLLHYEILHLIGKGGMGDVYAAQDTKLGRKVALKILPSEMAADPERRARFEREAKAVAALNHPNIVTIHSVEEADGVHFITMELVEGKTLSELIPESGCPLSSLLDRAVAMTDAVSAAHGRGITHRDLKPDNVMVTDDGRVKVLDFGLAKLRGEGTDEAAATRLAADAQTAEGKILGTAAYMSPEQAEGKTVDSRSDIFSLGTILYEMATGARPFQGDTVISTMSAILRDHPPPPSDARPDLPPDLARIVRRCLEKDPERRFQTAKDVRNELEDIRLYSPIDERPRRSGDAEGGLVERRFLLTTDHVRGLSKAVPRMIGDGLDYVDNEVDSETLVVFLHGAGGDHRGFLPVLSRMPYRGVAVTMFGFGPGAAIRPPLPLGDHHRLLRLLIEDLDRRLHPRFKVLVGHSSGADQCLRMVSSPEGPGAELDGLLLSSPNIGLKSAFATRVLAELTDDPAHILATFKSMGQGIESLKTWVIMQQYLVQTSHKFGTDLAALRQFGKDIVAPFQENADVFYEWARNAMDRVPHVRFLFAQEETADAETIIARHLDENVLGDRFTAETIQFASVGHMELTVPDVMLPHVEDLVRRASQA